MFRRTATPILAAAALAWPSLAQQQPAPAPVARAAATPQARTSDCEQLDAMRAKVESQRVASQAKYETAYALYNIYLERRDSVSERNYNRALADYNATFRTYQETSMRMLHSEMDCMRPPKPPRSASEPKGWMGITFSADVMMRPDPSGKQRMVFADYPTIEYVEWPSPAQKARVKQGDILISIDGADLLKGSEPFRELLVPGRKLDLKLKRGASTVTCILTVEPRPDSWAPTAAPMPPQVAPETPEPPEAPDAESWAPRMPQIPRVVVTPAVPGDPNGGMNIRVSYDEMTLAGAHVQRFPALKDYFGVDSGLLVLSVVPGTPAADAGLRDGDVIVAAGGKPSASPMELSRALRTAAPRASLTLDIVRQRKRQTVELKW